VRSRAAAVQDEGSQWAAIALAEAEIAGPDRRWLDMCAGPGGKAALLAGLAAPREARLLASDRAPHRARLAAAALDHAAGTLVAVADATAPAWPDGVFDRVLLDAPCSGLGALRRRPELRWRRRPEDVPRLAALQRQLLAAGLAALRPGGVLGYVTCSPHRAETAEVIADAVAQPTIELVRAPGQLWPHRDGTDAIYLALLRRTRGNAA
jgi:16S rRNA (cytosine967-C5)-methyltransferase